MKKIIILIACLLLSFYGISQTQYPKFSVDSSGQKLVVLTLAQAQALDNKTDLLGMFQKLDTQLGEHDSVCLQVVNEKDSVIDKQTIQIIDLKKSSSLKDSMILNLQKNISIQKDIDKTYEQQLYNQRSAIDILHKEIGSTKRKFFKIGTITGASIMTVVFLLIFK